MSGQVCDTIRVTLRLCESVPIVIFREVLPLGFYIRKGFNLGPLRLNLSRSGLGASFGVKGARIGIGPRGRYIHLGRGGLYYRQSLEPRRSPNPWHSIIPPSVSEDLPAIVSSSAVAMSDS